jgi:hypothetical protein
MASRNRNNKKNGAAKQTTPVASEEHAVDGRLIDVQVWKTISKGKVQGASVEVPNPAALEELTKSEPLKPSKSFKIPRAQLGKLIGPKGATIKKFEEHFNVQISQPANEAGTVETSAKIDVESENRENVKNAIDAIRQFLITGVAPWSEEQLITETVEVPKRSVREIFGEQGKSKALIGRHTRTQIGLPSVHDGDLNGSATIKISGIKAEDVLKAKEIIEDIVLFHCHPVTHPELIYMQMEVPQKYHGRILGPRGAHVARLEVEFKVRVFMPTQQQANLVVVGDSEDNVARCLDAIEDVMDDVDKKELAKAEADAVKAAIKTSKEEAKAAAAAAATIDEETVSQG